MVRVPRGSVRGTRYLAQMACFWQAIFVQSLLHAFEGDFPLDNLAGIDFRVPSMSPREHPQHYFLVGILTFLLGAFGVVTLSVS